MASAIITIGQKYGLPPFSEEVDFDNWIKEVEMWKVVTDLAPAKHGPMVYLSLSEKVRHSCSSLTSAELNAQDGLDKLTNKLKDLYVVNA